jgi:diaminohydroxyphosphoribosylaminopyrimidine deaminase/5-amino-6-(5-phosphoribosylamino)uracil reductase
VTTVDDRAWLSRTIELSRLCPLSDTAFSVGAVIVAADGQVLSEGYSRETDAHVHAEESALGKLPANDPRLKSATIYSSLEPCTIRRSRPRSCTQLILASGIPRVVFAWREPDLLVMGCRGAETLSEAGVSVVVYDDMAVLVQEVNRHLMAP